MADRRLYVRNYSKFQHYKNRRPPWTKLHRTFWDDPDLSSLPATTRLIALGLVSLASESEPSEKSESRRIEGTEKHMSRRLGVTEDEMSSAIKALLNCGFLASSPLAGRKQNVALDLDLEEEEEKAFKSLEDQQPNGPIAPFPIDLNTILKEI